jgi:signal transduction histidine kinase
MALTASHPGPRWVPGVWLLFIALSLQVLSAQAQGDPLRINDLSVLVDPTGQETIESVSQPARAADFQSVAHGFSAGYTRSVHWLRFTLPAPRPNAQGLREVLLELQPPYVDDVQIYLSQPAGEHAFDVRRGGDLQPHRFKEFPYRGFVYRVVFADERPRVTYIRLQTTSSSVLIVKAWEPPAFQAKVSAEYALLGALLGVVLTGLLVNVWHGFWRHEEIYRRYLAYLLATIFNLLALNGLAAEFFLPETPFWAHHWVSLGIIFVVIFGARFYMLALDIAHAAAWMRWVYRIQLWLAVLCLPAPFLGLYPEAATLLLSFVLVMMVTGTVRSIQLWRQRHPNGKILLLTHVFSLTGNLSAIPALLGFLPGQLWLIYGFQLRSIGTLLVLQLMLAKHVRAMQEKLNQASVDAEVVSTKARQERAERERQRVFLSMLTHELKTPLSIIRLRLGAQAPSPRMQAHAERAVEDIDAIVGRCAMVSELDDQAVAPQRTACRLDELLNDIQLQQPAKERLVVQIADAVHTTPLASDPLLLHTILGNLVDNALKYSPPAQTVTIAVDLHARNDCMGIMVRVGNAVTKRGLPDAEQIFKKYYRAPGAHQQSGSGLGLYIAKALAVQLGGTLDYRPETDRVIFELWLAL